MQRPPTAEAADAGDGTKEAVRADDDTKSAVADDGTEAVDAADDSMAMDADDVKLMAAGLLPWGAIPEFKACPLFGGWFPGMAYKVGPQGLGYYRDVRGGPVSTRQANARLRHEAAVADAASGC